MAPPISGQHGAPLSQPSSALSSSDDSSSLYVGASVEYHSASRGVWLPAKVTRVHSNGTYDLDCKPQVQLDSVRAITGFAPPSPGAPPDSTPPLSMRQASPPAPSSSSKGAPVYNVGDHVEYHSASRNEWIPAKVLKARPNGTFDLDCKPDVNPAAMRPATSLPAPWRKVNTNDGKVYYYNTETQATSWTAPSGTKAPTTRASPWREVTEVESGRTYFYNRETRETRWARPSD